MQSSQGVLDLLMVLRVLRLVKIMGQIKRFVSTLTVQTARNVEKDVFRLVTTVRQRKNSIPPRSRTSDLRILRSYALPLSHRDSMVGKAYNKVHARHVSCILLRSAISMASWGSIILGDSEYFLSHARDNTKKHLSLFLNWAQKLPSFLIYLQNLAKPVFLAMNILMAKNPLKH